MSQNLKRKVINVLKKIDKIFSFWILKWLIVPFMLLFFGIFAALLLNKFESFTTISYPHSNQDIISQPEDGKLLRGQKVIGEFTAFGNNLGIISFKFTGGLPDNPSKEDRLIFEIGQLGKKTYYRKDIDASMVREPLFFTFGFPLIPDSKGKIYRFEITSLRGNLENALQIPTQNSIFYSKYKSSKEEIFSDGNSFLKFFGNKLFRYFTNPDYFAPTSVYFFPLIFYFNWIVFLRKYVLNKKLFARLVVVLVVLELLFFDAYIELLFLCLFDLWIIAVLRNKYKASTSIRFLILIIVLAGVEILFGNQVKIYAISVWIYFLLLLSLIQSILEYKKNILIESKNP